MRGGGGAGWLGGGGGGTFAGITSFCVAMMSQDVDEVGSIAVKRRS